MLAVRKWLHRTLIVVASATVLLGGTASAANAAVTLTTTGAKGVVTNFSGGGPGQITADLYVSDPLTDGHCARWQRTTNGGDTWNWFGTQSCGAQVYAGKGEGRFNFMYRVCRTGVGNCSRAYEVP